MTGIRDDCALVRVGKDKFLLKSDLFIEDIHFKLGKLSFKTIGMRAVARVLSDFSACAGRPKFIGISIGIPAKLKIENLKQILNGVVKLSKEYKFSLVGGDTSRSDKLFLDVWGVAEVKKFISRSGAKSGDYIFISGKLGKNKLTESFKPKLKQAQFLAKNFKINSMIDISDGFVVDLYRILKESKKGACIYRQDLPTSRGESDLYRGEDYELIFTVDKSERRLRTLRSKFFCVGRVKPQNFGYKFKNKTKLKTIALKGYSHF